MSATVVGTFHSGFRATDETTGYVLLKTAQILEKQTGIVNEIRVRTRDPMQARLISERIGEQTGYKSISWQEAQEDLLSAITLRNVLMYTIVGAILLVASFGTYNIISTITHEKTRDIAILKSLGFRDQTIRAHLHPRGAAGRLGRRRARLGARLSPHPGAGVAGIQDAVLRLQSSAGALLGQALSAGDRRCPVLEPGGRLFPGARRGAAASRRHHPGRDMSTALIEARKVTKILGGIVPVTLVADITSPSCRANSSPLPAPPAPASRRYCICWGCSTCRPAATS